uniref:Uncharacterized protein n=1 Tax=Meloidogyne enterolobii TaxID=390850 RepID=A0A6V7TTL2_MELEN|nr:unnamed protein product [Meloidogyne enterolobii]
MRGKNYCCIYSKNRLHPHNIHPIAIYCTKYFLLFTQFSLPSGYS